MDLATDVDGEHDTDTFWLIKYKFNAHFKLKSECHLYGTACYRKELQDQPFFPYYRSVVVEPYSSHVFLIHV